MERRRPHRGGLALIFAIVLGFGLLDLCDAFKVPFSPNDVLPVLPRQLSWPVLNNLHSAVDLLPSFVGTVTPDNGTVRWKGACFEENDAKLVFTDAADGGLGGGVLHLTVGLISIIASIVGFLTYDDCDVLC